MRLKCETKTELRAKDSGKRRFKRKCQRDLKAKLNKQKYPKGKEKRVNVSGVGTASSDETVFF